MAQFSVEIMRPPGSVPDEKQQITAMSIAEVVDGSFAGLWVEINENDILLFEQVDPPELEDELIRLAQMKHEEVVLNLDSGTLIIASLFHQRREQKKLDKQFAVVEQLKGMRTTKLVCSYPRAASIANVAEQSLAYTRPSVAYEAEIDKVVGKIVADEGAITSNFAVISAVRDKLRDDVREGDQEQDTCLIISLIDGNSIALAEYDHDLVQQLSTQSFQLTNNDSSIIELILESPNDAKRALVEDSRRKSASTGEFGSSVERMLYEKQQRERDSKHRKFIELADRISNGSLSFSHSRISNPKIRALSVRINDISSTFKGDARQPSEAANLPSAPTSPFPIKTAIFAVVVIVLIAYLMSP